MIDNQLQKKKKFISLFQWHQMWMRALHAFFFDLISVEVFRFVFQTISGCFPAFCLLLGLEKLSFVKSFPFFFFCKIVLICGQKWIDIFKRWILLEIVVKYLQGKLLNVTEYFARHKLEQQQNQKIKKKAVQFKINNSYSILI